MVGFFITMICGIVVSLATGGLKQKVDRDLLSPSIYWLLPKEKKYQHPYNTVDIANEILARNSKKEME